LEWDLIMQIKHLALAAGLLLMSAGAASAAPALVTGDLNLRSGPGASFGVLTVLPGGATVNVVGCNGGWCRIAWRDGYGYASSSYLDLGGGPVYGAPPPVYYAPPPVVTFGFGWGGGPRWYGGHYRGGHYRGGHRHHH
jgi:uncharacterized protein YraI